MQKTLLLTLTLLLFSTTLYAQEDMPLLDDEIIKNQNKTGYAPWFNIHFIRIDKTGRGFVQFTQALTELPGTNTTNDCGNLYPKALAFDTNTAGGKAIYSMVLSAESQNKRIWAKGTGNCSIYTVVQDFYYGYYKNE